MIGPSSSHPEGTNPIARGRPPLAPKKDLAQQQEQKARLAAAEAFVGFSIEARATRPLLSKEHSAKLIEAGISPKGLIFHEGVNYYEKRGSREDILLFLKSLEGNLRVDWRKMRPVISRVESSVRFCLEDPA